MANQVITLRIRMRPTPSIFIPQKKIELALGSKDQVSAAIQEFFTVFEGNGDGQQTWLSVLYASQKVQSALFPDKAKFEQLADLVLDPNVIVKVIADDETTFQIPWELMTVNPPSMTDIKPQLLWGYNQVFQRTLPKTTGVSKRSGKRNYPSLAVGMLTFEAIPEVSQIYHQLESLGDQGYFEFYREQPPRSDYKADDFPDTMRFLGNLDIAHLSCLVVGFKYLEDPFLIFSDAFLMSLSELDKELRFNRRPLVFLDACDNSAHLMAERFDFLKLLIRKGSGAVITSFYPIPRPLATAFSKHFYEELTSGGLPIVHQALVQARRTLFAESGDPLALLFWLYGDPELEIRELSTIGRTAMSYNLSKIAQLLNDHSTRADIRLLLADLIGQGYERPEFQSYDDLEGQTRLEKILTILQVMQGFGDDKVRLVCEIMKKVRKNDDELHEAIDQLCPSIQWDEQKASPPNLDMV